MTTATPVTVAAPSTAELYKKRFDDAMNPTGHMYTQVKKEDIGRDNKTYLGQTKAQWQVNLGIIGIIGVIAGVAMLAAGIGMMAGAYKSGFIVRPELLKAGMGIACASVVVAVFGSFGITTVDDTAIALASESYREGLRKDTLETLYPFKDHFVGHQLFPGGTGDLVTKYQAASELYEKRAAVQQVYDRESQVITNAKRFNALSVSLSVRQNSEDFQAEQQALDSAFAAAKQTLETQFQEQVISPQKE